MKKKRPPTRKKNKVRLEEDPGRVRGQGRRRVRGAGAPLRRQDRHPRHISYGILVMAY